ncbi:MULTISPECIES: flagellar hook-length control protein FliK [unclassified Sphingomonas]|uniref:flagellar hook-length control protein FliK n=1 Tax=unclassified Sphingomonas TaxID=196159 RepID=UPI00226A7626|nr:MULTISPECIES: flagellar hook-length control protein FliK [unclassified Sphingomonas]
MIQPVSTPRTPSVTTAGRVASSPSPFTLSLAAVSGSDAPADPPVAGATLPAADGNARQDTAADGSDLPNSDASSDPRLAWIAAPTTATATIDMVVAAAPAVAADTPKPAAGSVPVIAAAVAAATPLLAADPAMPARAIQPATLEPDPATTPLPVPLQAVPMKAKPVPARAPLATPAKRAPNDAASPLVAQATSETPAIASADPDPDPAPDTEPVADSGAATMMVLDPAAMIAAFVPPAAPPIPAAPAPASGSAPVATPAIAAAPTVAGAAMVVPLQAAPASVTIPASPDPTSSIVAPVLPTAAATPSVVADTASASPRGAAPATAAPVAASASPTVTTQTTPATAMAALLPPLPSAAPDVTAVPPLIPFAATPLPVTGSDLASTMAITAPAPAPVPASSVSGIQPLAIAAGPLPIALPDPSRPATATPALQAFAGAMRAGWKQDTPSGTRDDGDPIAPMAASALAPMETVRHAVAATGAAQEQTLDTRRDHWPAQMIDHIESLRDAADATSSKIRVVPDALGTIDLSVKRDGDTIHVHFAAEQAATRTMLADAQPQLAEIAQSRGLRLGDTNVGSGGGQPQAQQQRMPAQPLPGLPIPAPARATVAVGANDDIRIA